MKLQAKPRAEVGKKSTKAVRTRGALPAILYGHGIKPLALEIVTRDFQTALHTKAGENVLIDLQVSGLQLKESTCRIKDIQHHPITDEVAHVDFTVISLTEKIQVKVPLVTQHAEEAAGVKEGGVLDVVHHEIEVECLPTQIPEKIIVDVKAMKIGDSVHMREIQLPAGVECKIDADEVIVALHPPAKEELPATEEAPTQPEVIEKGKKLEVEEGEEAPPSAKAAAPKTDKKE
ncbi:MAG: 50S ribosomal protein L25/general stress protein Ctc [Candidatus Omnitrophica bacterium]|nr:50S ribosomal protein L25/general stress protein Ctc [Candidatus Omnitrophota bacterium]